jgi:hypothetical protein
MLGIIDIIFTGLVIYLSRKLKYCTEPKVILPVDMYVSMGPIIGSDEDI